MNQTSINMMNEAVEKYGFRDGIVVDVGSYDINGTYKALFAGKYIGADNAPGPNVDVLMDSPEFRQIEGVDAVISGQTIEHVADVPAFMAAIFRVLKPGGILCIIAPSEGPAHYYPIWVRNYPEALLREVVAAGGFEILSMTKNEELPWKLVCCVAKKPEEIIETRKEEDEDQ